MKQTQTATLTLIDRQTNHVMIVRDVEPSVIYRLRWAFLDTHVTVQEDYAPVPRQEKGVTCSN